MKVINLAKIDFAGRGSAPTPPVPPGPTPTPSAPPKDVNFRDYDGSIVTSYTKAEFAALTALPANPVHEGLTGQGWNWTLANAQAYVAKYGRLEVGQMYITSDGKTRIHITLSEGRLTPYLGLGINGSAVVDWGDGSATETVTGADETELVQTPHTYASGGDYIISVAPAEGTVINIFGDEDEWQCTLISGGFHNYSSPDWYYINSIRKINIGQGVTSIGQYAFLYCNSLTSITFPDGLTDIGFYAFYGCYNLTSITFPDGLTDIGDNAFGDCFVLTSITFPDSSITIGFNAFDSCYSLVSITLPDSVISIGDASFSGCYGLTSITLPDSVISIGEYAFSSCYSLVSITLPDGLTSIGEYAFSSCYSVKEYYFMRSTPVSITADVFAGLPSDAIIYVPASSVDTYKAASGWSNYASQIQPMP